MHLFFILLEFLHSSEELIASHKILHINFAAKRNKIQWGREDVVKCIIGKAVVMNAIEAEKPFFLLGPKGHYPHQELSR